METNELLLIEQIHKDFDISVDVLLKTVSTQKENVLSLPENKLDNELAIEINNGDFLNNIGFTNTKKAIKSVKYLKEVNNTKYLHKEIITNSTNIEKLVDKYQKNFPFYKFILLSQVLKICEKYNLYLGHSSLYIDDIPNKNIEELKQFPTDKLIHPNNQFYQNIEKFKPLFDQISNVEYDGCDINNYKDKRKIAYYICASHNMFNTKDNNVHVIGKEIFRNNIQKFPSLQRRPKKVKDPIILIPVLTYPYIKEIGFLINTKWGKEAEDSDLIVPINN